MSEIISKEYFKIIQTDQIFRIEFTSSCPALINSLIKTKIILGATASANYTTIKFKAYSVKTLKQFLEQKPNTIQNALLLTSNLADQLQYLLSVEDHTIIGYAPENIIVINDKTFAFLGSKCVTELDETQTLISYPFSHSDFFVSPELLKITDLPHYVHYKTAYFSLACLVIYTLMADDSFYFKYLQKEETILEFLNNHPIKHTKLYWLLSRCLDEEPEKRTILLI